MSDTREELQELAARLARELVAERFPDEAMTLEQMEEALAEVKRELGDRLQRAWNEHHRVLQSGFHDLSPSVVTANAASGSPSAALLDK